MSARFSGWKAWLLEDGKTYRWINLLVWIVAALIVAGVGFQLAALSYHPATIAAWTLFTAAGCCVIAGFLTYFIKEEL